MKTGEEGPARPRLRLALANARGANMPKDNIDRAIKKAEGGAGENIVEVTLRLWADGTAIYVECATDNNTEQFQIFVLILINMVEVLERMGALSLFSVERSFPSSRYELEEEDFTMEIIDAGAEDVEFEGDSVLISCEMEDFAHSKSFKKWN